MIKHVMFFSLMAGTINCAAPATSGADGPSRHVPELQPLNHFVGSWLFALSANEEAPAVKWAGVGKTAGKWILEDRFIALSMHISAPDGSGSGEAKVILTYDEEKKNYRAWVFLSNGMATDAAGTWDEKSRAMTFVCHSDENEITTSIKIKCLEDGNVELKSVTSVSTEESVATVFGTFTRQEVQP